MSMVTTPNEFALLLATPEGQHIEFKAAAHDYSLSRLAEYCVALAWNHAWWPMVNRSASPLA